MAKFQVAKRLIEKHFSHDTWLTQLPNEWSGPFVLPEPLIEYYANIGPVDVSLDSYGNPFFLPRLAQLWEYQAGYRYDARTNQLLEIWDDDWIVVADKGADPFILSRTIGQVFFAHHGEGKWRHVLLFDNLEEMITSLLILAGVRSSVSRFEFTGDNSLIKSVFYYEALNQLTDVLQSAEKASDVLTQLGWVTG
jgi:hypothetical protein